MSRPYIRLFAYSSMFLNPPSLRRDIIGGALAFCATAPAVWAAVALLETTGLERQAVFTGYCLTAGLSTMLISAWCRLPMILTPGAGLAALFTFSMYYGAGLPRDAVLVAFAGAGVIMALIGLLRLGPAVLDALPSFIAPALTAGIGLLLVGTGLRQAGILESHPVSLVAIGDLLKRSPMVAGIGAGVMAVAFMRRYAHPLLLGTIATLLAGAGLGVVPVTSGWLEPAGQWPLSLAVGAASSTIRAAIAFIPSILLVVIVETMGVARALRDLYDGGWPDSRRVLSRLWYGAGAATAVGSLLGGPGVVLGPEGLIGRIAGGYTQRVGYTAGGLFLISPLFPMCLRVFGEGYQVGPDTWLHPLSAPLLMFGGLLCLDRLRRIDWTHPDHALPAMVAVAMIPLSFSVVNGVALGLLVHTLIQTLRGNIRQLHPVYGVLVPLLVVRYLVL